MSVSGDSDRGSQDVPESDSDTETDYLALLRYAADHLCATDPLFVEALPDGMYECKECRQPYKRPSRVLSHYATKHLGRLRGIVHLHMLGVPLPEGTGDSPMDIDDSQLSRVDPELIEVFQRLLEASTNVVTTRETLSVPLREEDDESERDGEVLERSTTEQYQTELTVESEVPSELNRCKTLLETPWEPFTSGHEFKLGGWFLDAGVGKTQFNRYFNLGLGPQNVSSDGPRHSNDNSFTSAHLFRNLLTAMNASGEDGDPIKQWRDGMVNFREGDVDHPVPFHYRNLEPTIKSFFNEPWFQKKLVFLPEKKIREDGVRMYTEMHTGDWWWNIQVCEAHSTTYWSERLIVNDRNKLMSGSAQVALQYRLFSGVTRLI